MSRPAAAEASSKIESVESIVEKEATMGGRTRPLARTREYIKT